MPFRTLRLEKDGKIARITLNRPEVLNAESVAFMDEMAEAVNAVRDDRRVRVLIIAGAGRAFCSGVDLRDLSSGAMDRRFFVDIEYIWDTLEHMDKAVICGIHGYCLGGGLQIALACDVRVATEDAILGLPAVRECLIPGLGVWRLPRLIGMGRAMELLLLGDTVSAQRAYEIGLVNWVVKADQLEGKLREVADRFLAVPHTSMRLTKRLAHLALTTDFKQFMEHFVPAEMTCLDSPEHRAAMEAFRAERGAKARRRATGATGPGARGMRRSGGPRLR